MCFVAALEAASLPRTTILDLRYTPASLIISTGADVKAVHRMLGHKSAAMTLDVYADLFDDDLKPFRTPSITHALRRVSPIRRHEACPERSGRASCPWFSKAGSSNLVDATAGVEPATPSVMS